MHGGMARKPLQSFTHVNQVMNLLVLLIELTKLRIHFQGTLNIHRNVSLTRYHFGNTVHIVIWEVERASDIADDAFCRHCTKRYNLNNLIMPILFTDIINDLLPAFIAEINIDIRHRHTLRIQETLEQQAVANRVNICDMQAVRYNAACCRATPRSDRYIVFPCPVDEIPDNQEIVDISHLPDDTQLIVKLFPDGAVIRRVTLV